MSERLIVKLTGPAVKDGTVDASLFASVLRSLQKALNKAADKNGVPREAVKLRLVQMEGNANDPEDGP